MIDWSNRGNRRNRSNRGWKPAPTVKAAPLNYPFLAFRALLPFSPADQRSAIASPTRLHAFTDRENRSIRR